MGLWGSLFSDPKFKIGGSKVTSLEHPPVFWCVCCRQSQAFPAVGGQFVSGNVVNTMAQCPACHECVLSPKGRTSIWWGVTSFLLVNSHLTCRFHMMGSPKKMSNMFSRSVRWCLPIVSRVPTFSIYDGGCLLGNPTPDLALGSVRKVKSQSLRNQTVCCLVGSECLLSTWKPRAVQGISTSPSICSLVDS